MQTNPEDWRPHSLASDWDAAMFMPFSFSRTAGELVGMGGAPGWWATSAQWQVMAVESAQAAFKASRHFMDLWRTSVRDRQDAWLEGWTDQAARMFAHANAARHQAPGAPTSPVGPIPTLAKAA